MLPTSAVTHAGNPRMSTTTIELVEAARRQIPEIAPGEYAACPSVALVDIYERSVGELNAQLDLSQSALSQHLARLREDHLVNTRREAQSIYYSLADGPARRIINALNSIYCAAHAPQPGACR